MVLCNISNSELNGCEVATRKWGRKLEELWLSKMFLSGCFCELVSSLLRAEMSLPDESTVKAISEWVVWVCLLFSKKEW